MSSISTPLIEKALVPNGLKEGEIKAFQQQVRSVCMDSRQVEPGSIFVALSGAHNDERRYIKSALERGAALIIGERAEPDGRKSPVRR